MQDQCWTAKLGGSVVNNREVAGQKQECVMTKCSFVSIKKLCVNGHGPLPAKTQFAETNPARAFRSKFRAR